MRSAWIVVCLCTLGLVSAGFAQTPNVASLTPEALAAILGPSAVGVSPSCAGLRGEALSAPQEAIFAAGSCTATATCASGTVSCTGQGTCTAVDRDCLNCEQGHVTCGGITTWCPTACNCNSFTGQQRFCCQCACTGDCFACCRCDGGGGGHCAILCG